MVKFLQDDDRISVVMLMVWRGTCLGGRLVAGERTKGAEGGEVGAIARRRKVGGKVLTCEERDGNIMQCNRMQCSEIAGLQNKQRRRQPAGARGESSRKRKRIFYKPFSVIRRKFMYVEL